MTSDPASSTPHDRKTTMFDFFVYLPRQLVSSERFLSSDVTHVVRCKWWLIGEQHVVRRVSWPRHGKNLWLFNCLIWYSENYNRQKYLAVWPWHNRRGFHISFFSATVRLIAKDNKDWKKTPLPFSHSVYEHISHTLSKAVFQYFVFIICFIHFYNKVLSLSCRVSGAYFIA